jgi:hypothetical protein
MLWTITTTYNDRSEARKHHATLFSGLSNMGEGALGALKANE